MAFLRKKVKISFLRETFLSPLGSVPFCEKKGYHGVCLFCAVGCVLRRVALRAHGVDQSSSRHRTPRARSPRLLARGGVGERRECAVGAFFGRLF
jgi:hypothetical protein